MCNTDFDAYKKPARSVSWPSLNDVILTYRVDKDIQCSSGHNKSAEGEGYIGSEATASVAVRRTHHVQQHANDEGQPTQ